MPTKHINRYVFQSEKSSRTRSWTKTTQKQKAEKSQEVEIWDQKSDKATPGRPGASCKMLMGAAEVGARSAQWSRAHPGVVRQSQTSQKLSKGGDMSNLECSEKGRTSKFQTGSVRQASDA